MVVVVVAAAAAAAAAAAVVVVVVATREKGELATAATAAPAHIMPAAGLL